MGNESQISPRHNRVALVTGGASAFIGALVLTGWYTHNTTLIQVLPAFVPMQYNTAMGFLLCGVGLLSAVLGRPRLATACGAAAGTIGLLTLIEYIFGLDLGIDQLLMKHYITVETSHPGRMAPNTALCFSLIATALLVRCGLAPSRRRPLLLGGLGALTLVLGVAAFVGYLTGASTAYGWGHLTRMAVHTAAGFMALGSGILAVAYREGALAGSEPVDIAKRPRRKIFILSTTIMIVATVTVALNVVRELHHTAVEQKKADLLTLVTSWAETMTASSGLDTTRSQQDGSGITEAAMLRQVTATYEGLSSLGGSSEFVLARREGDQIVFLLSQQRELDRERSQTVPFDSDRAEPMRQAFLGQSGTLVGLDYSGDVVLAAYTPFGQYGWGLVGKVDMAEVAAPFVRTSWLAFGVGFAVVVLGALALLLTVDPMIRGLEERTVELHGEVGERKRAEDAVRASEEHFRTLIENSLEAVAIIDFNGTILYHSPSVERIVGYKPEDLLGTSIFDYFHTDDKEGVANSFDRIKQSPDWVESLEVRFRHKDGLYRTLDVSSKLLPDGDSVVANYRDITERKQAEEALSISHRLLQVSNQSTEMNSLLRDFMEEVKRYTNCEAVGIRILDDEGNIPYQAYVGFSDRFFNSESPLSIKSDQCMCINVIRGMTNPELPFYTKNGSFYMNGTTRFLATVSEKEKGSTRNVCNQTGYESVALIPVRTGEHIVGLVHVADTRENMVPVNQVEVLEQAALQMGAAFTRLQMGEALRQSEEMYRLIILQVSD